MRFFRRSLVGLFLSALSLGLIVLAVQMVLSALYERSARASFAPTAKERVFAVAVTPATVRRITPVLEIFGEVQSRRALLLRAAVSGRVIELADNFEDGGAVRKGQILVRLDPVDAQAARARARADLADAQAELVDARDALDLSIDETRAAQDQLDLRDQALLRQQDLQNKGVGTAAAAEATELATVSARQALLSRRRAENQARARIKQGETRLARAQIALDESDRRLADTVIVAPFSGRLRGARLALGRLVSANEQLAELIDPDDLEVAARISTAQYARLLDDDGQLLPLRANTALGAGQSDFLAQGMLARASADAGDAQTGRQIFVRLENPRGFRPGDFVRLRIDEPALDGVSRLPALALGSDGAVLVLDDDERLQSLPVTLLRRQGDDILVRGAGLAGREIVRARTPLLGPGIRVRPLRPDAAPTAAGGQSGTDTITLSPARRASLIAYVEANTGMPADVKERTLAALQLPQVSISLIERLDRRMGQ